ncbi:uncharacterized protein LOC126971261 [Leptidea sinapis]|uniref:uncharacterized protein LOC126971261 n=1 Tax=Leptidea sinapis TaxID=189913 RepID=UPI0021C3CDAA|nr:uncharacterized protein LOC126971261 [Leptidea sinapis]
MSLFVDLRQIKTSVTNLSEMVDKISTSVCHDKRKKSVDSSLFGSVYKPAGTLGIGVRFSQSQEDIFDKMPSSRLKSHMSLPNLGKTHSYEKIPGSRNDDHPKIIEIDDEKTENTDDTVIQVSKETLNNFIIASINKKPFFDDSGDIHPMDFVENLKYYISELSIPNDKQLTFIISCLGGLPLMWARCFKSEFKDTNTFYKAFEQEFWSSDRQKSILYDMKLGKYDENQRMSMSEYFLCKVSNYKHLVPPPSDLEIIYSLAAHYPSAVELELRLTPKPSLRETYGMLRRREGEGSDTLPNYLYEMCESFQRGLRPDSGRRSDNPSQSADETRNTN